MNMNGKVIRNIGKRRSFKGSKAHSFDKKGREKKTFTLVKGEILDNKERGAR